MSTVRNSITKQLANGLYLRLDASNSPMQGNLNFGGYEISNLDKLFLSGSKQIKAQDSGTIYIAPFSDSYASVEIRKADNTTAIMSISTLTDDIGFGTKVPEEAIHVLRNENNNQAIMIENAIGGSSAVVRFCAKSDVGTLCMASYSSTFPNLGSRRGSGGQVFTTGTATGGLSICARASGSSLRFYAGGNTDSHEHFTITPSDLTIRSDFPLYLNGLTKTKSLKWNTVNDRFEFNYDLAILGNIVIPLDNKSLILGSNLDIALYYDGSNAYFDCGLINPSDLVIDCGLEKTIELTETVWDDLRIIPGAFVFAGLSDPDLLDWQPGGSGATFKVYKFKKNDEVFASCQMPHGYKEGSNLLFHLHWTPCNRGDEENGNSVGWKVDYTIANPNGDFLSSATVDLQDICSGVDDRHELTSSVTVNGNGLKISNIIQLRIYRSDTGTDDTWVGITSAQSPALLEFDIHFEKNTIGSRQELIK